MPGPRRIPFAGGSLSALLTPAADPAALCVVAHGAGSDMRSDFLQGVAVGFAAGGVSALRFNFSYTESGRKAPDRAPALLEAWRSALAEAERLAPGLPLAASGKSLGGRMASMLAAEEGAGFGARALVFFGYPLHAPGRPQQPRSQHLAAITVPMLFIQGTADPLATFPMIESLVEALGPLAGLHAVDGGNHSFRGRGPRLPDEEIGRGLGEVAARFVREAVA